MDRARLFFVTDALDEGTTTAVAGQLKAGKTVVVMPKNDRIAATVARLAGAGAVTVTEAKPSTYAMFGEIDFRHALFSAFADPRFSDFTHIHIWHYRRFDAAELPGGRVLARFDNRDPALMEIPIGNGRILLFTFGWHLEDSQWALSTKFVPLLHSILDLAGERPQSEAALTVGQPIPIPPEWSRGSTPVLVQRPGGNPAPLSPGATQYTQTDEPGIYALSSGGQTRRWAVNLDPSELRTAPMPLDEFERLGALVKSETTATAKAALQQERLPAVEAESRQKLWRWFLLATLAVLISETALAGWVARRPA